MGLIVFDQLTSSQPLSSLPFAFEVAHVQDASEEGNSFSLSSATADFPLQALKIEEIELNINQRLRPAYGLFSIALQLFAFENEAFQPKTLFFYVKPLCLTTPIYILLRQILL